MTTTQLTDLWWLPEETNAVFLELAHQGVGSEDFQIDSGLHASTALSDWRRRHHDTNVFRSVLVFDSAGRPTLKGPFYVDVDSDLDRGDVEDAHLITRLVVATLLAWSVNERNIKILFSGRKGFNIEVRPEALDIPSSWSSRSHDLWETRRKGIIDAVKMETGYSESTLNIVTAKRTVIDTIKGHLRLEGSLNSWVDDVGETCSRRKEPVGLSHFLSS